MNATQWLELFQSFTHVKEIRVMEAQLVPSVVEALVSEEMDPEVLPELGHLFLCDFPNCPFMLNAAEQFVAMRSLIGRPVFLAGMSTNELLC